MILKKIPFTENTVTQTELSNSLSSYATNDKVLLSSNFSAEYDSNEKKIWINYNNEHVGQSIDATPFLKDGMLSNVQLTTINNVKTLTFTFNTDAAKQPIQVQLTGLYDLPIASSGTLGGVKINGNNLAIAADGTLSAGGGGGGATYTAGAGIGIDNNVISLTAVIPTKTSELTNDSNFLTAVPDGYATQNWVQGQNYLTAVPDGYATKNWVEGKNYLTSHQSLTAYYTKTEIDNMIGNINSALDQINGEVI